jgi:DNA-damage-inducible protein J
MQSVAMKKSAEVRTRIEPGLKEQSTEVLAGLGLDMSDAIRLFLRQVVEVQGLPFDLRKPSGKTVDAMIEARAMAQVRFSSAKDLFDAIEKKPGKGKARHIAEKV